MNGVSLNDRTLIENNALSLGWHIGFYQFVLAIASQRADGALGSDDTQVLVAIKSRINELARFFNVDTPFVYPTTPEEAKTAFANLGLSEHSQAGSSFVDILATHHGRIAADLYSLGRTLMVYALVAGRGEPEVQVEKSHLMAEIRRLSADLGIPRPLAEECLTHPETLGSPSIVDRIMTARRSVDVGRPGGVSRQSPWSTGSFYLVALVVVATLLLIMGRTVNLIALPIVLIGALLGLSIIGALQLRHDEKLSDKSFLELMRLSVRSLPLLRRGKSREGEDRDTG